MTNGRREQLSAAGKKGGAVAVATGQIHQIRTPERSRRGGLSSAALHMKNGTGFFAPGMQSLAGTISTHKRWHLYRGIWRPGKCFLCAEEFSAI